MNWSCRVAGGAIEVTVDVNVILTDIFTRPLTRRGAAVLVVSGAIDTVESPRRPQSHVSVVITNSSSTSVRSHHAAA